jgi:tRNA(fMet)-specific endonuclease VapC
VTPRYLLDTNICIAYKKRKPGVPERVNSLPLGEAVMSLVTWGELVLGAEKSQYRERSFEILQRVREIIPVLGMEEKVGNHYGAIRGSLEKAGQPIGPNDMWIAAHALAHDLKLVTNNTGEFSRVAGLALEDWTTP